MNSILDRIMAKHMCCHEWEEYTRDEIVSEKTSMTIGRAYILICKKCGKIKELSTNKYY